MKLAKKKMKLAEKKEYPNVIKNPKVRTNRKKKKTIRKYMEQLKKYR